MILHKNNNPVFVVGSSRSGTTMLVRLMRNHLNINFGPESQFIVRYYKKLHKYGDLESKNNFKKLVDDIANERFFKRARKNFNFEFNKQSCIHNIESKTYAALIRNVFEQFAAQQGFQRWGDKTPEYSHRLEVIENLFPDAQYIHIVRDGRDVALSLFKTHFGPKNVYTAAKQWKTVVNSIDKFKKTVSENKFLTLRYEDILKNPKPKIFKLIAFLCHDCKKNIDMYNIEESIIEYIDQKNFFKWKNFLNDNQIEVFNSIAQEELIRYGYPVDHKNLRSIKFCHSLFWELQNLYLRGKRLDTWQDNFYKLKLRLIDFLQ